MYFSFLGITPLTATVRPTSNPDVPKHSHSHAQNTPTASIRPIAHSAPTAMISPVSTQQQQQPQAQDMQQPSASIPPFATFRQAARATPATDVRQRTSVAPMQALSATRDEASTSE